MTEFTHDISILRSYAGAEGMLAIDGKPLSGFLPEDDRPAYIYSGSIIEARIAELRQAMPRRLKLHYAMKANPFPELLKLIAPLVDGFDVASIGEVNTLLAAGLGDKDISFAGPGKSRREIEGAIADNITIVVESSMQLFNVQAIARKLGKKAKCMVRLNDLRSSQGGGLSMAGARTGFGWDLDDFQKTGKQAFLAADNVEFYGVHLFFGSQILKPEAIESGLDYTLETLRRVNLPCSPRVINLGGGLGIPYAPTDQPLNLGTMSPIWERITSEIESLFPVAEQCIELGRFIVGPAGVYLISVLDKKTIAGTTYLVCSGGLHHFSAATGNFGQVFRRNHPLWPMESSVNHRGKFEKVTVIGPLCTPMDVMARDVELPFCNVGDGLVLFQAGAYGLTASPVNFLSHGAPNEMIV